MSTIDVETYDISKVGELDPAELSEDQINRLLERRLSEDPIDESILRIALMLKSGGETIETISSGIRLASIFADDAGLSEDLAEARQRAYDQAKKMLRELKCFVATVEERL